MENPQRDTKRLGYVLKNRAGKKRGPGADLVKCYMTVKDETKAEVSLAMYAANLQDPDLTFLSFLLFSLLLSLITGNMVLKAIHTAPVSA